MRRLIPALLLPAVLLLPGAARAQEGAAPDWANKSGAVGIGGSTTLAGSNGINIRTYVTPQLGLELTFGFALDSVTNDDTDTSNSQSAFQIGLTGAYKLAYWQRGHLSAFLGLDIQTLSNTVSAGGVDNDQSATDILISLGIMGEYFPTQYLSLFMRAGLLLDFIGEDELVDGEFIDPNLDNSGIAFDLGSQLEGLAGFTVWFK